MGTTIFVWDPVFDCVSHELDGTGAVKASYTNEPQQYGGVISQHRDGTTSTLHADTLGSTRFLTDQSVTVTDNYLYDAWGNTVAETGSTTLPFKWVGKYGYYSDESTTQVYVRARVYQPTTARWTSVDPLGFVDGWDRYCYSKNMVLILIDPSGAICRVETFRNSAGLRVIRNSIQPENDPYYPTTLWAPIAPSYPVVAYSTPNQKCDGCEMCIELDSRAQRY